MSDLDNLTNGDEPEKMEQPNAKKNHTLVMIGFGVVVALLFVLMIFDSGSDDDDSTNDGIQIESRTDSEIESGENKTNERRNKKLEIPDFDDKEKVIEKKSLSDQLLEDTEPDTEKLKAMLIEKPVAAAASGAASIREAILREEAERLRAAEDVRKAKEDRMRERMAASMDGGSRTSGNSRGSALAARADQKRDEIDAVREQARNLQGQIANKSSRLEGLSGLSLGGRERDQETVTQLIKLPTSTSRTIQAGALEDKEWLITEGTIIQAVIESGINSNLPGKIRAITTLPVRSYTGNAIIIPRGSELIGQYSAAQKSGEARLFVIWTRLITPDGISINLDSQGVDPLGVAGIGGRVNSHFFKRFGASLMLSIVGGATQQQAENSNQVNAIADSFNRSAELALENSINIPPTLQRNQGASVAVFVNSDLNFKAAMLNSRLAQERIARSAPDYKEKQPISYDRVFDTRDLSYEERALLANRFIADGRVSDEYANRPKPYTAKANASLRATIKKWAELSNYIMKWDVSDKDGNALDWNLPTDIVQHSNLYEAVGRVLDAYRKSGVPLTYQFFNENDVLIVRMGDAQ